MQKSFKADYEKTLKEHEYLPQLKIVDVNLKVDLFPYDRNYSAEGYFILVNKHRKAIDAIHVQKLPNYQVTIEYLNFEGGATVNNKNEEYGYYIHELNQPLEPGDSTKMEFKQTFTTWGFVERRSNTQVVYNGTFINVSIQTDGHHGISPLCHICPIFS